jgi:putative transposase
MVSREVSARRACELLGISRRWICYLSQANDDGLSGRLKALALKHPRYGYRRLWALLRREGEEVNVKRIRRLCVISGLKLGRRKRRKRGGIGKVAPVRAEHADHVWAYDFVHDACRDGRQLKILTIVDEYTRECLAVEVEHRMPAGFVCRTLLRLFGERGRPVHVRSDNGPEFIAKALMKMLAEERVGVKHIEPGSPWQNGKNERFNGSLRDECLNAAARRRRGDVRAPGPGQTPPLAAGVVRCAGYTSGTTTRNGRTRRWGTVPLRSSRPGRGSLLRGPLPSSEPQGRLYK